MKNFKGFDDWIEIFKGGKQIDSSGVEHDGDMLIDKTIATFNPGIHEPPIVVGHPKDNAPAFGWIQGLKKTGNTLLAKIGNIIPEFEAAVENGMYKKRSASFYPDGRLRHVGFLGAAPPAVKGLADLKFDEGEDFVTFEFGEHKTTVSKKEEKMTFKDFVEIFKFWKEAEKDPDMQLPGVNQKMTGSGDKSFTEADIEAAKKSGAEAERKKADTEFAEKERQTKGEARTKEISDFCDTLVKEGKIPPSWVNSGLVEFAKGLDSETEISFSEKEAKKSPAAWFKSFLEGFEKSAIFQELATKEKAGGGGEFAEAKKDQELGEAIAAKANPVKD